MIAITGPTGQVGREVVQTFSQNPTGVRLLARNLNHPSLPSGFACVRFDFEDPTTFASALESVTRLFLVYASADEGNLEKFLRFAKEKGIEQLVVISGMGADESEAPFLFKIEECIRKIGLPCVALRANWFMQNFGSFFHDAITKKHELAFPDGKASISFVDTRDLAAAAHHFLTAKTVSEGAYTLTGPESLTHAQVATLFTKHLPYSVTYRELTEQQAREELGWNDLFLALFKDIRNGLVSPVNDTVKSLLGRPARTLEAYITENLSVWLPLHETETKDKKELQSQIE